MNLGKWSLYYPKPFTLTWMANVHEASIWSPPPELLGISKQTWFGSHWNDTRLFHIREISAHCWAGRKQQCEICCGACGWACGTDPTLSHSHLNKLGHASVAFSEWALPSVIYYYIFMPTRQEFTCTPRRQTTTWLCVTMSINALHYLQCLTKTYLCSLIVTQIAVLTVLCRILQLHLVSL